jgi:hypothetical protein
MLLAGLSVASTLSHKNARAAFARPSAGALSAVVLVVLVNQARLGMSMSRRCSLCVVAQLEGSTSAGCGTAIWSNVITRCEGRTRVALRRAVSALLCMKRREES